MLGDVAATQVGIPALNCCQCLEAFAPFTPVSEIRGSHAHVVIVLLGHGFPHRDNPIELGERERPQ